MTHCELAPTTKIDNNQTRFLCVHCHYYQPPRENPWLEQIEQQDTAYPYHDWNERITSECYARNYAARILDSEKRIERIVNLYSSISFNFGPTLLSWMQEKSRATYEAILRADAESRERFGGHGSAIAQCYNHAIMPLANSRDKRTQVLWGIADFRSRFGRDPEGMWLPETAVDRETLSILAGQGIRFTILAPTQVQYSRAVGVASWIDVTGGRVDPKRPYRLETPSGPIAIFAYDGPVSRAVAFERLLDSGITFAERLLSGFAPGDKTRQLMHIATDGETYGHHHKFGEMALAYALQHIEQNNLAQITNYGQYLELNPPEYEAEIIENTAWSCAHGVGRWSTDCGCSTGANPHWNQKWRAPLRSALDWLRDTVNPLSEERARGLFSDFWSARDAYVVVVLNRSPERRAEFAKAFLKARSSSAEKVAAWKLLELQRSLMLMYTSCGWFFDEVSGIETVQIIAYAARAIQLAADLFSQAIEEPFLEKLALAPSNIAEQGDAAAIYRRRVKPGVADLTKVGAHYAVNSIFERYLDKTVIYCYDVQREELREAQSGRIRLAMGRARITSKITLESEAFQYAVLHFGDQNLYARIGQFEAPEKFTTASASIADTFSRSDLAGVIAIMAREFPEEVTLRSLFKDAQREIAGQILSRAITQTATASRRLYENHAPLLRMLHDLGVPPPVAFRDALAYALNGMLDDAFRDEALNAERIRGLLDQVETTGVALDGTPLELTLRRTIDRIASRFFEDTSDLEALRALRHAAELASGLPFPVSLWSLQNRCYRLSKQAGSGKDAPPEWRDAFQGLCQVLRLKVA